MGWHIRAHFSSDFHSITDVKGEGELSYVVPQVGLPTTGWQSMRVRDMVECWK